MVNDYMNITTDRFAVIGLGDTGVSIIKYLHREKAKILKVFDTRMNPPHPEEIRDIIRDIPLYVGKLDYTNFDDIDVIVISPGVSIYDVALQMALHTGKAVIGDVELFALAIKNWHSKVIGITGSNGKTTVTTLTGYLSKTLGLKTIVAGNIGIPVLDSYIQIINNIEIPDVIVLELSSFQLETTYSLKLASATVLNISEDHLDRYRDLLEYAYIKSNIFNNCQNQVLNSNDNLVSAMQRHGMPVSWFGNGSQYSVLKHDDVACLYVNQRLYISSQELQLFGWHNYYNILVSLALLKGIGVDIDTPQLLDALRNFNGLEHRMQKVTTHNGITYIDDSKGTNVGAVIAGVKGLDNAVHLILGGDGKGQDFSPLRELVMQKCKSVAIIGQDKLVIAKILEGLTIPCQLFTSLEDAVVFCMNNAKNGEYVVLSPACASWDMFNNYKHRAQVFIDSIYANIH